MIALVAVVVIPLWADALRRVYAVGREANDHFVAALVSGCVGFYAVQALTGPRWLLPAHLAGVVGLWGLFFCFHRDQAPPRWQRWILGYGSQIAYAYALWAGLLWLLRVPFALALHAPLLWAGAANLLPLGLAIGGCLHTYRAGNRPSRHTVPGLPVRVAQLSDLHASPFMHREELRALVELINREDPALVLVTGDLVMPFSEAEHGYLLDALAALRAPLLACPGNHDLPVLDRLRAGLAARGQRLLVDEAVVLELEGRRVEVAGVLFHWREARVRLGESLAQLRETKAEFRILMAHDPRLGAWVPPGRFDLVLSGHTHGGHVAGNWLGLSASVLRLFSVRDQGWFDQGRHYVHRGNWLTGLPPRMGVTGEVAFFGPADQSSSTTTGA